MSTGNSSGLIVPSQVNHIFVPGFKDAYCGGSDGFLWSRYRRCGGRWIVDAEWNLREGTPNHDGYLTAKLYLDGKYKPVKIHQLIAELFLGPNPQPGFLQAAHKNGVKLDNRVKNLYYATPKEQAADKRRHKTLPDQHGEWNPKAIISQGEADMIREEWNSGKFKYMASIAKKHGISNDVVYSIIHNENWVQ